MSYNNNHAGKNIMIIALTKGLDIEQIIDCLYSEKEGKLKELVESAIANNPDLVI